MDRLHRPYHDVWREDPERHLSWAGRHEGGDLAGFPNGKNIWLVAVSLLFRRIAREPVLLDPFFGDANLLQHIPDAIDH